MADQSTALLHGPSTGPVGDNLARAADSSDEPAGPIWNGLNRPVVTGYRASPILSVSCG